MIVSPATEHRQLLDRPYSELEIQLVRQEREAIMASSYFRGSRTCSLFLTHIVEAALSGRSDEVKERSIGVEVFGRPGDYDTNIDPVVRRTAAEVRKRLALYYSALPARETHPEISLQPGTYVPEFYQANGRTDVEPSNLLANGSFSVPPLHPEVAPVGIELTPPKPSPFSASSGNVWSSLSFWAVILLVIVTTAFVSNWWWNRRNSQLWWADFFTSTGDETLIVLPEVPAPSHTDLATWRLYNPDIALEDMIAAMPPTAVLIEHHVSYRVKLDSATSLNNLVNRPAILIGGPSNKWTVQLTEPLRYHLEWSPGHLYIVDSRSPSSIACSYEINPTDRSVINDCALIALFHSTLTGSTVMVIAGTGRNGTRAAGQWIVLPGLDATLSRLLPAGWKKKNIELVLKTTVIDGESSSPMVVRAYSW